MSITVLRSTLIYGAPSTIVHEMCELGGIQTPVECESAVRAYAQSKSGRKDRCSQRSTSLHGSALWQLDTTATCMRREELIAPLVALGSYE